MKSTTKNRAKFSIEKKTAEGWIVLTSYDSMSQVDEFINKYRQGGPDWASRLRVVQRKS